MKVQVAVPLGVTVSVLQLAHCCPGEQVPPVRIVVYVVLLVVAGLLSGSSTMVLSVTAASPVFVTTTVKVTGVPDADSGNELGLADFVAVISPAVTRTGTWKVSSQLHFDVVPGVACLSVAHTLFALLSQLVQ
jgi:hypothetical protein